MSNEAAQEPDENTDMNPHTPRPFGANLLYLVTMLLVLTIGAWMQTRSLTWGLLGTEFLLILLPTLLWVRYSRVSVREALLLKWPGWTPVVTGFLLGLGLWVVDMVLANASNAVFGYSQAMPPQSYPSSAGEAVLFLIAFTVAAPFAEEAMFRGYILSAYQRLGATKAIVGVGVLFAAYHLTAVGFVPRIPIGIVLCYVAWRTGSLYPGIALHMANNLVGAGILAVTGLAPGLLERAGTVLAAGSVVAFALGIVGYRMLRRLPPRQPQITKSEQTTEQAAGTKPRRTRGLTFHEGWPLVAALLIFVGICGVEFVTYRYPALLARKPLSLEAPWTTNQSWKYRLENARGDVVGSASCDLTLPAGEAVLTCEASNEAFEFRTGSSYWSSDKRDFSQTINWKTPELSLQTATQKSVADNGRWTLDITPSGNERTATLDSDIVASSSEKVPREALLDEAWPWQLQGMQFGANRAYRATVIYPTKWDQELERNGLTLRDELVQVVGTESLELPWGHAMAWHVKVGNTEAWYDAELPHTLLRYNSGVITWVLEK